MSRHATVMFDPVALIAVPPGASALDVKEPERGSVGRGAAGLLWGTWRPIRPSPGELSRRAPTAHPPRPAQDRRARAGPEADTLVRRRRGCDPGRRAGGGWPAAPPRTGRPTHPSPGSW